MDRKISELTSLLFKTKQLIRQELPTQHDPNGWMRLEILNFIASRVETNMRDIALYLRIRPPSATSLVSTLQRDGLVVRRKSLQDKRTVLVSLTSKGNKALGAYRITSERALQRVFSRLEHSEIEILISVLTRLHESRD